MGLELNADLLVLSVCETGQGRMTSEGVIGLARSLIAAGTSTVLVALWPVDDESTAHLMIRFYENLGRRFGKAQALRQAILETRKQDPFHWAAFTLIGEATG